MRRLCRWPSVALIAQRDAAEGAVVFAKACEVGLEGVISKREGSFYRSGKSRSWPKFLRTPVKASRQAAMIHISLTAEAYAAIAETLLVGSVPATNH
jgi:hypothetical protein